MFYESVTAIIMADPPKDPALKDPNAGYHGSIIVQATVTIFTQKMNCFQKAPSIGHGNLA